MSNPPRTLFVTDMDGTLLDAEAHVSPETSRIITDLSAQGALITVATARTPATVQPLLANTRMNLPAIVMTGTALWHTDTQKYSDVCFLPEHECEAIDEAYARAGVTPFIYTLDETNIIRVFHSSAHLTNAERKFVEERTGLSLKRFYLNARPTAALNSRRLLQFAMGTGEAVRAAAETLYEATSCAVSYYRDTYNDDLWLLEIFAPGVSKARAVAEMKRRTKAERLIVYGDNLNDLPMMAIADVAVAVDNALDRVKDAADIVIGPHTTDAVARHMRATFNG